MTWWPFKRCVKPMPFEEQVKYLPPVPCGDSVAHYSWEVIDGMPCPTCQSLKEQRNIEPEPYASLPPDELIAALRDAATSLETISSLAGRKSYGEPPIETFMESFADVRSFASSRASVARDVIAKLGGVA